MFFCISKILNLNKNIIASPASSKLGMRMTTLHEEPSSIVQRPLAEEPEDSYSDPEYGDFESSEDKRTTSSKQSSKMKTRMTTSKTMGSLTELGGGGGGAGGGPGTTNILAYTSTANAAMRHIVGTPSMSSSASSGYGSQVFASLVVGKKNKY